MCSFQFKGITDVFLDNTHSAMSVEERTLVLLIDNEADAWDTFQALTTLCGEELDKDGPFHTWTGAREPAMDHFLGIWRCQNYRCSSSNPLNTDHCSWCGRLRMDWVLLDQRLADERADQAAANQ